MTDSATSLPQPSPDSYTVQDWIRILHNGSQVGPEHPQYAQVRQIMGDALARIAHLHLQQNEADSAAAAPGVIGSSAVKFGHGASVGLAGDPEYLAAAQKYHPLASTLADAGGGLALMGAASPLVAGLSPAMGGAVLGGAEGAGRGAVEAGGTGAAIGGLAGAAGGAVGGKVASVVGTVAKNVGKLGAKVLGKGAAAEGGELIGGMPETQLRSALVKQGFTDKALDRAVAAAKAKMTPQVRTQAGGVTTELPAEKLSPIAGTEGRGFEVTGERAMPPAPSTPTIAEIQERLGQARARFEAHGFSATPGELPQPSGGATLTPKGAAPAADPTEPFPTARRITGTLQQAEEKAGRPLLPEEKERVLAAHAAKFNQQQFGKERAVLADVERRMGRPLTQEEKRQVLKKLLGDYTKTQPWSPATPE